MSANLVVKEPCSTTLPSQPS